MTRSYNSRRGICSCWACRNKEDRWHKKRRKYNCIYFYDHPLYMRKKSQGKYKKIWGTRWKDQYFELYQQKIQKTRNDYVEGGKWNSQWNNHDHPRPTPYWF